MTPEFELDNGIQINHPYTLTIGEIVPLCCTPFVTLNVSDTAVVCHRLLALLGDNVLIIVYQSVQMTASFALGTCI